MKYCEEFEYGWPQVRALGLKDSSDCTWTRLNTHSCMHSFIRSFSNRQIKIKNETYSSKSTVLFWHCFPNNVVKNKMFIIKFDLKLVCSILRMARLGFSSRHQEVNRSNQFSHPPDTVQQSPSIQIHASSWPVSSLVILKSGWPCGGRCARSATHPNKQ